MSDQRKLNIEEEIKNSGLSDNLQKSHIELCRFLEDNEFLMNQKMTEMAGKYYL